MRISSILHKKARQKIKHMGPLDFICPDPMTSVKSLEWDYGANPGRTKAPSSCPCLRNLMVK